MGGKWIKFDSRYIEFICANYDKMTVPKITLQANALGFGTHDAEAVRRLIRKHGLTFFKARHNYTNEQIEFIKDNQHLNRKQLLIDFNEKFNLRITSTALGLFCSQRKIKAHEHPARFKKGQNGWRGGKPVLEAKGVAVNHAIGEETRFKEGQKLIFNHVPVGYERKDKRGFIEVRVNDGTARRNYGGLRNFALKHHLIWEQHHGEIPIGHVVIFKDGNKENFDIDNLMAIPRGAISVRSRLLKYEEQLNEFKPTINVLAALIHKTNKMEAKC